MEHSGRRRDVERFVSGDVVVLDFPFSNLVMKKRRPALVLRVVRENLIIVPITSNMHRTEFCVSLSVDDFLEGGLHVSSVVRTDFLVTCSSECVLYRVGCLRGEAHAVVAAAVCAMLRGEA